MTIDLSTVYGPGNSDAFEDSVVMAEPRGRTDQHQLDDVHGEGDRPAHDGDGRFLIRSTIPRS